MEIYALSNTKLMNMQSFISDINLKMQTDGCAENYRDFHQEEGEDFHTN